MIKLVLIVLLQLMITFMTIMGLIFMLGGYANSPEIKNTIYLDYYMWLCLIVLSTSQIAIIYKLYKTFNTDSMVFWMWSVSPLAIYILLAVIFQIVLKLAK